MRNQLAFPRPHTNVIPEIYLAFMNKMEDTDTSLSIYLLTLYYSNTIQSPLGPVKLRRFIKIELSSVISLLNTNLGY
jgi:hypothetical protein